MASFPKCFWESDEYLFSFIQKETNWQSKLSVKMSGTLFSSTIDPLLIQLPCLLTTNQIQSITCDDRLLFVCCHLGGQPEQKGMEMCWILLVEERITEIA